MQYKMSAPPPYPGNEKGMPPPNPAYPQQAPGPAQYSQPGYAPQYGGYAPQYGGYPQQGPGHPQQGYPAQYGQQATTVVVAQPAYTVVQNFRESPVRIKCQFCQADIVTSTYYDTGTLTWIACFVIFIVGCWLGCCLIPFCLDGCKDVVHQCPNCNQQVGRYNRM
ncbi:lipopolysaccharide-induced tumor necrosis factor-alpha factor homolog isoform X5 [Dreissena polymorpha]|uniref:lipopolysaccharide-induced tumor necrosis factor-alpha factor homolog isoform X5 n=2 Tax=Dreissena polymorpha TaxID=45954 RepID=UPI00226474CE|nr:lipopolysaccharide-induced tumor necrosis factor-alpha factor homolog isoform X5 [Dreissena polymorpha]